MLVDACFFCGVQVENLFEELVERSRPVCWDGLYAFDPGTL